jgi:hypothetical protein
MKKSIFVAVAVFLSAPALAQSSAPPASAEKMKLEVTRAELQLIGQGLMELPYKASAPVMNNLQTQLFAIDQAAAKAAEDAKMKPADKPEDAAAK